MTVVKGVDYSHYQGNPDVGNMSEDGVEFVLIKAWEGDSPDPEFKTNYANAKSRDLPVMAYVFLHASDDDERMAACFNFLGPDVVLCLDWEAEGVPASV